MGAWSTVLLTLLVHAPGDAPKGRLVPGGQAESVASLERAFQATAAPEILLSIAAVYARWPDHCTEELEAYKRFFDACKDCAILPYAVEGFDHALDKCMFTADQEMQARRRAAVATLDRPVSQPADSTRQELVGHLRRARVVDPVEVGRLYVTFIELGSSPDPAALNTLRQDAFTIMARVPATPEGVLALVARIKTVDVGAYEQMLTRLMDAQRTSDQGTLDELRIIATELLRTQSSTPKRSADEARAGCRPNAQREWGFLTVNTTPWSEIYVNGARHGTTPVAKIELLAGCVAVRALNPVTGQALIRNVTIRPNKVAILRVNLEAGTEGLSYR